jgi:hypothetical protein
MLEVGQFRSWHNVNGRCFIIHNIDDRLKRVEWKYLDDSQNWNDRLEYVLLNSFRLSPVLKELYD